ncbi:MAG: phosphoenolpyruvate--protein phosphotransferase [Treponema sp.]|jgi:phosphotransferase system enzyme I (PtsI)|nr:phosphoenolpyruvate--protein phosphotransferase [Treponema sp.]
MKKYTGNPVSPGIALGKAFVYLDNNTGEVPHYSIQKNQLDSEWSRFLSANDEALAELTALNVQTKQEVSREDATIFDAYLMMLEDTEFQGKVRERLETSLQNVEWVIKELSHEMSAMLMASPDPYLQERAVDIADVLRRLVNKLLHVQKVTLADLSEDVILVCRELLPSDALTMNKARVKAIVMDMGGATSHTAILARAFEIPALVGLSSASKEINTGDMLIVNGVSGELIVNPEKNVQTEMDHERKHYYKQLKELRKLRDLPAETRDGYRVSLKANIEIPEEAEATLRAGCEGIGLYRSEFLFLAAGRPTGEEEQFKAYSHVLEIMGNLPVTLRTADAGGDKLLPELQLSDERNPILGWRAIRFSLSRPELFKTQLRAMLRAGVSGNLRIMFPMISGIEELEQALAVLEEAKSELRKQGKAFAEAIPVGTMIEIPSAALTADILAEKSSFFSIGTNDLVQYTIAVDRGNEKVSYLAQPFHPAILRSLKQIIDAAHAKGITAAMCGEMAGNALFTALLLGLGLDEFSMNASAIPRIKWVIRNVTQASCGRLAKNALRCTSYRDVGRLVEDWTLSELGIKNYDALPGGI